MAESLRSSAGFVHIFRNVIENKVDPFLMSALSAPSGRDTKTSQNSYRRSFISTGRQRRTAGKYSASEEIGPKLEPLCYFCHMGNRDPLPSPTLVGDGMGAVTYPIDRKGTTSPRRPAFLLKRVYTSHYFTVLERFVFI